MCAYLCDDDDDDKVLWKLNGCYFVDLNWMINLGLRMCECAFLIDRHIINLVVSFAMKIVNTQTAFKIP